MRAQAFFHFLITYGWALILLGTALAAMIYFGIIDVERFQPPCGFQTGFSCLKHQITPTGLILELQNNLGQDITIQRITDESGNCSASGGTLDSQASARYTVTGCTHPSSGNNYKSDIRINYALPNGIERSRKGHVRGKVD